MIVKLPLLCILDFTAIIFLLRWLRVPGYRVWASSMVGGTMGIMYGVKEIHLTLASFGWVVLVALAALFIGGFIERIPYKKEKTI